jgi:predicted Rdx family selenoprotein
VFEVVSDGELVYSKKATGEFPEPEDIVTALGAQ